MAAFMLSAVAACLILAGAVPASASSPRVFTVGGEARGWRQPAPGEETYNHWASRNRFHVGDLLCKHQLHRHPAARVRRAPLLRSI
jgi:hypothetical protein